MLVQFIPHGHCYLWKTNLVGLHLLSDLLIAISYYSIPATLLYFVRKSQDLPFAKTFLLFGAFIISCGTVHLAEVWTLWHPDYWISGIIKAGTALISLYTAMEMYTVVPQALSLPSPSELKLANSMLEREISERKQVEIDLESEKAFIEAILDNLSDGIVACDRNGTLALFNRASQKFFGMPQPLPAEQWSESYRLYSPDGKTPLKQDDVPLVRAFSGESFTDAKLKVVPKNGKARHLLANGSPILNIEGVKLGAVVAVRDVTEHQQAVIALQKRESTIKSFYDSAPMMMGIVELIEREDLRHVSGNNLAAEFFGLTSQTIAGKRTNQLSIPQKVKRKFVIACLQSEARLEPVEFEFTYQEGVRHKHFFSVVSIIAQKPSDDHPLFSYIIQDISDRKRIEIVLQESEERFRLAFEDAATGMTMVAINGEFLKVNRSLCEILGFTEQELTALTFQEITHPDDLAADRQYIHQLIAGEISGCQFQKRYIHKQGHIIWIHLSVSLVRGIRQQPQYFIAQIQDITDRKTAEIKLTKSLQEKEVMLQEIHHRVKNNLQVICSLLNLQSRYLTDEKILKAFKETQTRVKSMALVHEQLYQSTNLSEIVLSDYIKQLTGNLFRAYSISSNIKYNFEVEDFNLDLDTAVPCGLIINELITNAIKYAFNSQDRGEISIQATANEENSLVLVIEDNGIGMKPRDDFATIKSLGLRLVKNLTEQLLGKYEIVTEQNVGTKFKFTFDRIKK